MSRGRPRSRAGMTLMELAIAMTILLALLGVPGLLFYTSSRDYSTKTLASDLSANARRVLRTVATSLSSSSVEQIDEAAAGPGLSYSQVTYRRAIGLVGGAPAWSEQERLELQPSASDPVDGIDNDGNGFVDERILVLIEDLGLPTEASRVLCRNVRASLAGETGGNGLDDNGNGLIDESGLSVSFDGEQVSIGLTLERQDSHGVRLEHTAWRMVALRN